jgi:hypothetical protein
MQMNQLFWTRTNVGAFIYYALGTHYTPIQGVINESPYISITVYYRVNSFICIIGPYSD